MLKSPAKLNLGLKIVGRRDDGYHLLESLFWPINLCDEIQVEPSASSSVFLQWTKDAPASHVSLLQNSENPIGKLVLGHWGWKPKVPRKILIQKRIPIGGGLGGISSNLGTLLNFFMECGEISKEETHELALKLGADVPFFLDPHPSWITGVGEKISKIAIPPNFKDHLFFLLVCFPMGTSTPLLFESFRKKDLDLSRRGDFPMDRNLSWGAFTSFCKTSRNDLEKEAAEHYPLIGTALDLLRKTQCIYGGLSGTGSTCFGVYDSAEQREKAAKVLSAFCRDHQCRSVFSGSF